MFFSKTDTYIGVVQLQVFYLKRIQIWFNIALKQ